MGTTLNILKDTCETSTFHICQYQARLGLEYKWQHSPNF